jgi:signal transduction histidine kinase/CheY-like chemotaxis protein
MRPENLNRIRAAQVRSLYRGAPAATSIALAFAVTFMVTVRFADGIVVPGSMVWLGVLAADVGVRLWLSVRFARAADPDQSWQVWAGWFVAGSLFEGFVWGAGAILFAGSGLLSDRLVFLYDLMLCGMAVGGLPTYGIYPPALYAFILPPWILYAGWSALQPSEFQRALLVFFASGSIAVALLTRRSFSDLIQESLRLRFENLDLIDDLRIQKERADQASTAKSRFLAAASHDLRQPMHALGLFVAALDQRVTDPELRRLIEQARGSVEAMDRLFAALLDISRLDANVIEVKPRAFAIQPVLERLCRDHAGEAAAKGVRLVLHPCSLTVMTDPLLLERILGNLIANAVRYTETGRVVVGCRRGPGRLRIAVLDTGPGIPPAEQELVFEEFHQLGNPARDRAAGLGLGLAIVRRLSVLLALPVSLRSVPGRGTAMTVEVPLATLPAWVAPSVPERAGARAATGAPTGAPVLVIDDEAAIREGMQAVLSGWGHEVVVAASGTEAGLLVTEDGRRPGLILCDFRLPRNEDGITVIRELQRRWAAPVPAILITGDTAPDRLAEARASGLLLLHKPLALGKLRAAMNALMATGS